MVSSGKVSVIICYRVNVGVCNVCVGACTCECTCTRKCDNVHSCMDTCSSAHSCECVAYGGFLSSSIIIQWSNRSVTR